MVDTDIIVNGFKSKDNPYLRWCKKDNIPSAYTPVSKKASKGFINTAKDDTPTEDTFSLGELVLCIKEKEEVKEEVKENLEGDK